ncbi:Glutamyl-tRNA synthetase [Cichlidogyrus casuarinus]|uniref:Nondiscriminating glutamyl-tRNA synthetase EARS2, mitochondrial n=1 Tax=Cichlidogyrus casuarinus TaxID=1844966 RepID=A0ABD2PU21_9PLAT
MNQCMIRSIFYRTYHSAKKKPRFRYAPSPTGFMHIGGLRTCFINYLHAKKTGGTFILRIEDTDRDRFNPNAIGDLYESLDYFGIIPGECPRSGGSYGPYIQSERKTIYDKWSQKLLDSGSAYRCFCSVKRLELLRKSSSGSGYDNRCRNISAQNLDSNLKSSLPFVIRLKLPKMKMTFIDDNYGSMDFLLGELEGDPIMVKTDGMPVYHFANVVDDHLMKITNVVRGAEWLTSTAKHLALYNSFGWNPPDYCHLPLMTTSSGKKLSKRSPEFEEIGLVKGLRKAGYLPEAILKWLVASGGGFHASYRDMNSIEDFINNFDPQSLKKESAQVDVDQFKCIARETFDWFLDREPRKLVEKFKIYSLQYHPQLFENFPKDDQQLIDQFRKLNGRLEKFSDLYDPVSDYRFIWIPVNQEHLRCTILADPQFQSLLAKAPEIVDKFRSNVFSASPDELQRVCKETKVNKKLLLSFLRLLLTGNKQGLPLQTICELISMDQVKSRLDESVRFLLD